nr:hypothetical protein [Brucella anthropi]
MAVLLTNNATSLLAGAIDADATTLSVENADAGKFPNPAVGDWFPLTIVDNAGNMEVLKATARAGAIITVERAKEGTTAKAFASGARVDLRATAAALYDVGDRATTATVGVALAQAESKEVIEDEDTFALNEKGGTTPRKTPWAVMKAALTEFFYTKAASDGRFVSLEWDNQQVPARKIFNRGSEGGNIGANTQGAIEIQPNAGAETDAFMSFHVPAASKRINLGFRPSAATLQDGLQIGGGSMGAVAYMIYNTSHFGRSGNANGILAGGADYNIYSSAALLSAINNRVGTRAAPQNCSWSSGILEFGSIDPGHGSVTIDLPAPYVMVGIRSESNSDRVYARGATLKNTA